MIGDDGGNDVALRGGNVGDATNSAVGGDGIEFPVIGLDGVESAASGDHAVPSAVGLEVIRIFMPGGIGPDEGAEVGDLFPRAIGVDEKDTFAGAEEPVRAASASFESVEATAEEDDIGDTADEIAEGGASLTGRKMVGDGGDVAKMIDFGEARGEAAGVRAGTIGKSRGLVTFADGRERAASTAFSNV